MSKVPGIGKIKKRRADKKKAEQEKRQTALAAHEQAAWEEHKQAVRKNPQQAEKQRAKLNQNIYTFDIGHLERRLLLAKGRLIEAQRKHADTTGQEKAVEKIKQQLLAHEDYAIREDDGNTMLNVLYQQVEDQLSVLIDSNPAYKSWRNDMLGTSKSKIKSKTLLEQEVIEWMQNHSQNKISFSALNFNIFKKHRALPASLIEATGTGAAGVGQSKENIEFFADFIAVNNKTLGYQLKMFFNFISEDTAKSQANISDSLRFQIETEALIELAQLRHKDNVPDELQAYLESIFPNWPDLPLTISRKVQHYESVLIQMAAQNANQGQDDKLDESDDEFNVTSIGDEALKTVSAFVTNDPDYINNTNDDNNSY